MCVMTNPQTLKLDRTSSATSFFFNGKKTQCYRTNGLKCFTRISLPNTEKNSVTKAICMSLSHQFLFLIVMLLVRTYRVYVISKGHWLPNLTKRWLR